MARSWIHRILEIPLLYRITQRFVGGQDRDLDAMYREVMGDTVGPVLDVGCGPTVDTPIPDGPLVGLDVNPRYVARYRGARHSPDGHLGVVASAARIPFRDGSFEESRTAAVLHHLPDELATECLREMRRVVRPGGRVIVFDMVWPASFRAAPVAWLICRFDRGRWVREEEALDRLAREACPGPWRRRSFDYTRFRLRGTILVLEA